MDSRTRAFARSFTASYRPIPVHLFTMTAYDPRTSWAAWERLTRLAEFEVVRPEWKGANHA